MGGERCILSQWQRARCLPIPQNGIERLRGHAQQVMGHAEYPVILAACIDSASGEISGGRMRFRSIFAFEYRLPRSEEHTSELQSLMRISYAVFCLKKKTQSHTTITHTAVSSTQPYVQVT